MIRLILILFICFSFPLTSNAGVVDYYCPKVPYDVNGNVGGIVAQYSGLNYVVRSLTEKLISNVLKNEFNTDFDVELKVFDKNNLLNGKFKSLSVFGQNAKKNGLYFSTVSAQTLCGLNHIKYKNDKLYFYENLVAKFSVRIDDRALKQIINSNEYISYLKKHKLKINGNVIAEISGVDISIKNDKIEVKTDLNLPFIWGPVSKSIEFSTKLGVKDGRVVFYNVEQDEAFINLLSQVLSPLLDVINPFVYKMQTKEKYDIILKVENVKIENSEIFISGIVVIPKDDVK